MKIIHGCLPCSWSNLSNPWRSSWARSELVPFTTILPLPSTWRFYFRCSREIPPVDITSKKIKIHNIPMLIFQEGFNLPSFHSMYSGRLSLMEMLKKSFWFPNLFQSAQYIGFLESQGSLSIERLLKMGSPHCSFCGEIGGTWEFLNWESHEDVLTSPWILPSCH